jgi:uncharacterized membrane protein
MAESGKVRYLFVDLLRGWAVILMIEAHVVNGLLLPELKETTLFSIIHFLNGSVAPAFLFMAGFTFAVASQRKWAEYLHLQKAFYRQVGRLLFILLLGYALHLPYFSLRKTLVESTPNDFVSFFQVDILHTIAISLLALLFLLLIVREEKRLRYLSLFVAAGIVFTTPVVWDYDFAKIFPLPLASYFNAQHGSPFPLFPWSAFVFCGVVASQFFLSARKNGYEKSVIQKIFWAGATIVVLGILSDYLPFSIYRTYDFWHTSPSFFMIRLGIVMIALTAMYYYEKRISSRSLVMQTIGQESLFVYTVHIVLVYGSAVKNGSLVQIFGPSLNFADCLAIFLILTIVTCLIAYAWHFLKTSFSLASRWIQYAAVAVFFYLFVTRAY